MIDLRHGDSLKILPMLKSGSVSAVVTDPPYGQSNEAYDRGVPPEVWRECYRIAKVDAALISFAGNPTYHRIASDIERAGWRVRQMWAWVFTDGLITSAHPREGFDRLAPAMTPIVFATKGKVILPLRREGEAWTIRFRGAKSRFSARSSVDECPAAASGHWPRSVVCSDGIDGFQYFRLSHNAVGRNRTGHPNEKPLALMEWLVGKLPPGTILDPYCGSATTAVACQTTGHDFIGIERSAEYMKIARRRIRAAKAVA